MVKIKDFNLKEHIEGKEKSEEEKKKEEKEQREEITEEDEEIITNSALNNFLANQYKEVSLEKNDFLVKNLEEDLPEVKKVEKEEEEKIEYMIKNESEKIEYNPEIKIQANFIDPTKNDANRIFSEQKIMYHEFQNLSNDHNPVNGTGLDAQIKYIKPEDTQKKNDLSKKKFY